MPKMGALSSSVHLTTTPITLMNDLFGGQPTAKWDLVANYQTLTEFPYMRHAFIAALCVAIMSGAIGWFMVLRSQSYAGHTLSIVAFPGAAGAALAGLSPVLGFFTACVIGAAGISWLAPTSGENNQQSAVIGSVQAFALALGLYFASQYHGFLSSTTTFLFGSYTGITNDDLVTLITVTAISIGALIVISRPLLFASVDASVAAARGVPVRALSVAFLCLLALSVAGTSRITGSLLVFALLAGPPAAAQKLTNRPLAGVLASIIIGILCAWLGLSFSYFTGKPAGFLISLLAAVSYALCSLFESLRMRRRR